MASITIRNLNEEIKDKLRVRAAKNKRSMEEEVRKILSESVTNDKGKLTGKDLYQNIRNIVEPFGGVELPEAPREEIPNPTVID